MKLIGLNGATSATKTKTPDALSTKAKQFLNEIDLRKEKLKKTTLKIVSTLNEFPLPEKGEQIRIRTQTQINLISLVLKLAHDYGVIDELTITTYTLNKESFAVLKEFLETGKILKLNLLIASSYSFREPDYFNFLKQTCLKLSQRHAVSLVCAWIHFKITLARCGEDFYQFEGSMNYSTNNMAEQLLLCNDRIIYDYDYSFINIKLREIKNAALEIVC